MAVVASGALLLVATGCGKAGDKIAEKASEKAIEQAAGEGADVDLDSDGNIVVKTEDGNFSASGEDGSFKMETEDGSFSSETGKLPASWPDDLPLPTNAKVQTGTEMSEGDSGAMVSVTSITSASVDDVEEFYDEVLSDWEQTNNTASTNGDMSYIQQNFVKADRAIMLMISESDEGTMVNINHSTGNEEE